MRLFFALEIPIAARAALVETQRSLQARNLAVRWVAPEAMHLTLVFLGAVDAARLPELQQASRSVLVGHQPLNLMLAKPGVFPHNRSPQVVWVGVGGDVAPLTALQASLSGGLEPLGFPRETRPYHPHATLGRVRRDTLPDERNKIGLAVSETGAPEPVAWRADHVTLFESQTRSSGVVYLPRDTILL